MKENLLKVANVLVLATAVLFLGTIQTSLWFQFFGYFPSPAFWIPVLVYVALTRSTLETVIFAYVTGFVLSTMTAMPEGTLMIVCLGVAIATQLLKERIYWTAASYIMMTCGLASLLFHVLAWILSFIIGDHPMTRPEIASWMIEALLTPLMAPSLFPVFRWIDDLTQREQVADVATTKVV